MFWKHVGEVGEKEKKITEWLKHLNSSLENHHRAVSWPISHDQVYNSSTGLSGPVRADSIPINMASGEACEMFTLLTAK